jgi:hypothetical protein
MLNYLASIGKIDTKCPSTADKDKVEAEKSLLRREHSGPQVLRSSRGDDPS